MTTATTKFSIGDRVKWGFIAYEFGVIRLGPDPANHYSVQTDSGYIHTVRASTLILIPADPPKFDAPKGYEHTHECRPFIKGEIYAGMPDGAAIVAINDVISDGDPYAGRRWILKKKQPKPTAVKVRWMTDAKGRARIGVAYFDTEPGFVDDPTLAGYHSYTIPLCKDGRPVVDIETLRAAGYQFKATDGAEWWHPQIRHWKHYLSFTAALTAASEHWYARQKEGGK